MASAAPIVRYLPKALNGKPVLFQEALDIYRVDLSVAFGDDTAGIVYRASRNLEDRDTRFAAVHGESIPGREVDGWIEVEIAGSGPLELDARTQEQSDLNAYLLPSEGAQCGLRVSGCGSPECRGMYEPDGMMNGRARYRSEQSSKTINYTSGWWLLAENYKGESWYAVQSKSGTPPVAGWIRGHRGQAPPPMVELGEAAASAPVTYRATPAADPYATARVRPLPTGNPSQAQGVWRSTPREVSVDPALGLIMHPTPGEPSGFSCCGLRHS